MDFESWTNGWRLLTRRGICATTALDTFLIQQTEGQSFADLSMELFICATNLLRGERQVFSRATTLSTVRDIDGFRRADGHVA